MGTIKKFDTNKNGNKGIIMVKKTALLHLAIAFFITIACNGMQMAAQQSDPKYANFG